jgi:N-ethylmaleimide reductase
MRDTPTLLTPYRLGPFELPNRVVLAPMTRNRAGEGRVPTELNATYYAQRASAGLLITEATYVAPEGIGYPATPGIDTDAQVEGWKLVTGAVHEAGGLVFLQLWHVGRISHPDFQPGGGLPVAPSAVRPTGESWTYEGKKPFLTPRALETDEIPERIEMYRDGARRAKAAGFDGVEIHGANGYLIDQFLRDGTNRRTDGYGGSVENRVRFLREVTEAVARVWGAERVGVRLSPQSPFNDMRDSDPATTFGRAAEFLDDLGVAYIHTVESIESHPPDGGRVTPVIRERFGGAVIVNGDFDRETAEAALARDEADLVSFGRLFLANPDLPERLRLDGPYNEPDVATFYGGGPEGYTDYPTLERAAQPV